MKSTYSLLTCAHTHKRTSCLQWDTDLCAAKFICDGKFILVYWLAFFISLNLFASLSSFVPEKAVVCLDVMLQAFCLLLALGCFWLGYNTPLYPQTGVNIKKAGCRHCEHLFASTATDWVHVSKYKLEYIQKNEISDDSDDDDEFKLWW